MTALSPLLRLSAFLAAQDGIGRALSGAAGPIALGWSTVELDRAADELAAALELSPARFLEATGSAALGARCRVGDRVLRGGLSLVLLEPATEGRLAASLARTGEGPVAVWLVPADTAATAPGGRVGPEILTERDGPLGPERLVLGGPIAGPYRLLVDPAGTIRP